MKIRPQHAIAAFSLMVFALLTTGTALAEPVKATLYHNPGCMCCEQYASYLDDKGYNVEILNTNDMAALNDKHGVKPGLASCHTMLIGDYVVVGHVPEAAIAKLLREKPDIRGIALPGMPAGSPGMGGQKTSPFVVRTLSGDVYATY
ncbi:DUF411 domain-containing protein [Salinisphaera orenii]|uniref:DUF411 domain-containing protein n=1 Tax=Salinisphaera orenii TaxID=856731 RepID=UPI000DBEA4EB